MIEDVARHDERIHLARDRDLSETGEHCTMLVLPPVTGERLPDMPVCRVENPHATVIQDAASALHLAGSHPQDR